MATKAAEAPATTKRLQPGTPEGDKLVRVRCMKRANYRPTPALQRNYEIGEELTIPMWRFTDFHTPEVIQTERGTMTFRGAFEMADRPRPIDDNVAHHSEIMQDVLNENERLRERLAKLEAATPIPDEIVVIPEQPSKRGRKEEM